MMGEEEGKPSSTTIGGGGGFNYIRVMLCLQVGELIDKGNRSSIECRPAQPAWGAHHRLLLLALSTIQGH